MTTMHAAPTQPVVGVGVVVVRPGGDILLVERGHPPLEGCWSVPGGKVELGEATAAAAVREVREETGVEVVLERLLTVVDRMERDPGGGWRFHYVLVEYLARPLAPDAAPLAASDARQARWASAAERAGLRLVPDLEVVLALAGG